MSNSSGHSCVKGCNRVFPEPSHLTKHKATCQLSQDFKRKVNSERRARGLGSLLPKNTLSPTVRASRKARLMGLQGISPANSFDAAGSHLPNDNCLASSNSSSPQSTALPQSPQLTRAGRPRREYKLPQRFRDYVPESLTSFIDEAPTTARCVLLIVRDRLATSLNLFGLWREYPNRPSTDPDSLLTLEDLANHRLGDTASNTLQNEVQSLHYHDATSRAHSLARQSSNQQQSQYWPFENATIHSVMTWLNNGHIAKSESETTKFVHDVILSPTFQSHHLLGFDARQQNQLLDQRLSQSSLHNQFSTSSLQIQVPSGQQNVPAVPFDIPGFLSRSIVDVIKEAFTGSYSHLLHFSPFRLFHRDPNTGVDQRIYGEVYSSDAFLAESDKVRYKSPVDPNDPNCQREKVVAALMFSSDATHLTEFGNTKAWPIYLMLGNLSKYIRSQVNSGAMHHLAYIPALPEAFNGFVESFHPKWKSQKGQILTHCKRELLQEVWRSLLDSDFVNAYKYGIVVIVLLATIRDKGMCPCPQCLAPMQSLDQLGTSDDQTRRSESRRTYNFTAVKKARAFIYKQGKPINGTNVEALLKEFSGVPTVNAFVDKLGTDFNPSNMLVVDLLHEFELGVWKSLFSHLIRLLYAVEGSDRLVVELDRRFSAISTFGRGTIRKFSANSSEMKKMAARDYEDLLQCCIPVFWGLLPEPHNQHVAELLYTASEWHALAKLRMHTETSLQRLHSLTTDFGVQMRLFRDTTCAHYQTVESPREAAARVRRELAASHHGPSETPRTGNTTTRKPKTLNLQTVKMHFLGDYVEHIRMFGMSDSYSTQLGEFQHRIVKQLYGLTNKNDPMPQVARKYIRQEVLRPEEQQELLEMNMKAQLQQRYTISESRSLPMPLLPLVAENGTTLSSKKFIPKLRNHLLARLLDSKVEQNFTEAELSALRIRNNIIFGHSTVRVNYTTYDMRRDFDTINPRTHPFIMVMSPEAAGHSVLDSNPRLSTNAPTFWYAAVLGVFHADVQHTGSNSRDLRYQPLHFLWVRWFEPVPGSVSGQYPKLPKLRLVPEEDEFSYGFLDPSLVLRGCHFIPAFYEGELATQEHNVHHGGRTIMSEAMLRQWQHYHIGIFVDRDMYMRHSGLGLYPQSAPGGSSYQASVRPEDLTINAIVPPSLASSVHASTSMNIDKPDGIAPVQEEDEELDNMDEDEDEEKAQQNILDDEDEDEWNEDDDAISDASDVPYDDL
ncbi:hypothetical protein BJ165DRAFT_1521351 [Panaeolus papilionaceus]|nr:hypothetical protein BJ165DRAFT_1521351 [Panaeolus papilionaceus]